ncbi:MAG: M15 family metallopeptidase [Desulforhopalus sp.]
MKRRCFLKLAVLSALLYPATTPASIRPLITPTKKKTVYGPVAVRYLGEQSFPVQRMVEYRIKDYLMKIRNPDAIHHEDISLDPVQKELLKDVVERFERLMKTIGHGNFAIIGFDEALSYAKEYPNVQPFTAQEIEFLDMIFHRKATDYGFYGKKQVTELTQEINRNDVVKIAYSGNFLFKGEAQVKYEKIKRTLGKEVLLTSGIRGLVKQFYLYLHKANRHDGNLSLASRSLAPPGYSYHATGDFDIGQVGLGEDNFSEKFTATPVFKKLAEQGYVEYRYQRDNLLGVRYEPWHVKLQ